MFFKKCSGNWYYILRRFASSRLSVKLRILQGFIRVLKPQQQKDAAESIQHRVTTAAASTTATNTNKPDKRPAFPRPSRHRSSSRSSCWFRMTSHTSCSARSSRRLRSVSSASRANRTSLRWGLFRIIFTWQKARSCLKLNRLILVKLEFQRAFFCYLY